MSKQDKKELRQQIACEWLEENYLNYGSLRHDVVTDRLQIKAYKPTPNPSLNGGEQSAAQKSFPLGEDLGEASSHHYMITMRLVCDNYEITIVI